MTELEAEAIAVGEERRPPWLLIVPINVVLWLAPSLTVLLEARAYAGRVFDLSVLACVNLVALPALLLLAGNAGLWGAIVCFLAYAVTCCCLMRRSYRACGLVLAGEILICLASSLLMVDFWIPAIYG